ncbi:MAG: hypothetical protein ACPG49_13735, partial [Chitinophagales bacterium]
PNFDLFAKIEAEIDDIDTKMIPLRQVRMMAAAAIVLLSLNIGIVLQYSQNQQVSNENRLTEITDQTSLISDYKLYE